jgi:asparagine synthase (glutamine-hydrolysing)
VCGLSGFLDISRRTNSDELKAIVISMVDALFHRGPDDGGAWADEEAGIALGHHRLSIIDLSLEGHQPMHSACGRYVISFNGEIYSFKSIRSELQDLGHSFRGHSDTEVLLASVSRWGLEKALSRFNGMFAFALWDRSERKLHLVRDRLGEKPLYYGWMGKTFLFGSELKALRIHPVFKPDIRFTMEFINFLRVPC